MTQSADDIISHQSGKLHKTIRLLISLLVISILFTLLGWLAILSPRVPYNIRELFATDYPLLTLFIFLCFLYWGFGIPVYLALWISKGRWIRIMLFPLLVVLHGAVAYIFLRISVPMESIYDIVGSPILNWSWEWELLGRFVALFGIFSLFLIGGVLVALLQSYDYFFKWKLIWRWIVNVIILLPIGYWVVVKQAATDNLTELMKAGGNWISIVLLCSWIFIIACVTSTLLVHILGWRRYRLISAILLVLLSFPIGYLTLHFGTENAIYKYGQVFSAMQFLFSVSREHYLEIQDIIFRYIIFHTITIGIITLVQYPFWSLMCDKTKIKVIH